MYSSSSVIINTILLDVIRVMELLQLGDDVFLARGTPNHNLFNASSLKKAVMYKMNQLMKLKNLCRRLKSNFADFETCAILNVSNTF